MRLKEENNQLVMMQRESEAAKGNLEKDKSYLQKRQENEMLRLRQIVTECEDGLDEHKARLMEAERESGILQERSRGLEV